LKRHNGKLSGVWSQEYFLSDDGNPLKAGYCPASGQFQVRSGNLPGRAKSKPKKHFFLPSSILNINHIWSKPLPPMQQYIGVFFPASALFRLNACFA